jgi:type 1 glutamine amidotransferase
MAVTRIACFVGDFYHDPAPIQAMLGSVFSELDGRADFFTEPEAFPWAVLDAYSVVVVAKEARPNPKESAAIWSTEETEGALSQFVERGGALLVLHSGLSSYTPGGTYSRLTRGRFLFHPQEHPRFLIQETVPGGTEFQKFAPFEVEDEMYFVYVNSENTEILLRTYSADYGSSAAAWRHVHGKGRVFCYTLGHRPEVLNRLEHRGLIRQALTWLLVK